MEYCNLQLVDTDTFKSVYDLHKDFILNISQNESTEKTKKFIHIDSGKYYIDNEINIMARHITNMTRYYIFRK